MPKKKMKTHKATVKRIKVTKTGKLMRLRTNARHKLAKKSSKRKRRNEKLVLVAKPDRKRLKRLIAPAAKIGR